MKMDCVPPRHSVVGQEEKKMSANMNTSTKNSVCVSALKSVTKTDKSVKKALPSSLTIGRMVKVYKHFTITRSDMEDIFGECDEEKAWKSLCEKAENEAFECGSEEDEEEDEDVDFEDLGDWDAFECAVEEVKEEIEEEKKEEKEKEEKERELFAKAFKTLAGIEPEVFKQMVKFAKSQGGGGDYGVAFQEAVDE